MEELILTETLNASISNVWKFLSDYGGVSKWASLVTKSSAVGQGVGAVRTCSISFPGMDEFDVQEVIEILDENTKTLSYRGIDNPALPIKNGAATWKLDDAGNNKTKITYKLTFNSTDNADEFKKMLGSNIKLAFKDLEKIASE